MLRLHSYTWIGRVLHKANHFRGKTSSNKKSVSHLIQYLILYKYARTYIIGYIIVIPIYRNLIAIFPYIRKYPLPSRRTSKGSSPQSGLSWSVYPRFRFLMKDFLHLEVDWLCKSLISANHSPSHRPRESNPDSCFWRATCCRNT